MVDQLLIYRVFAIHILQQTLQLPLIKVIDIAVPESIKALLVEGRISLRQNSEIERRQRQYLTGLNTIIDIVRFDESILPLFLCLKSPKFEVYNISNDVLSAGHWILHDNAIVKHHFSFDLRLTVFWVGQLEDTELEMTK